MNETTSLEVDEPEWLTIGEAAKRRGVSISTLIRAEKAGGLVPDRTPGGHRRYLAADLDEYFAPKASAS